MADRFLIFRGETQPSLREQLFDGEGEPLQFGVGDTVKLRARLSGTDTLSIDTAAVIEDDDTGEVRYDWQPGDTDVAGHLIAWWFLTIGGNSISVPQFVIPIVDQLAVDPGVGVYASVLDVKALAGWLADKWTPTSQPSEDDIGIYLAMTSGEIDAVLLSRGAALPLDPTGAVALALRSLTADGALVRALGSTWPSDPPAGVAELRKDARGRYYAGLAALAAGTHAAALALATTSESATASTLEIDDPTYGLCGHWDEADRNPSLAPAFHRGQQL